MSRLLQAPLKLTLWILPHIKFQLHKCPWWWFQIYSKFIHNASTYGELRNCWRISSVWLLFCFWTCCIFGVSCFDHIWFLITILDRVVSSILLFVVVRFLMLHGVEMLNGKQDIKIRKTYLYSIEVYFDLLTFYFTC